VSLGFSSTLTDSDAAINPSEQPLATLASNLLQLQPMVRAWVEAPHQSPLSSDTRQEFETLADDLGRKADDLEAQRPLLVVMLMGGTGVGKSSLLNALAGSAIAQASFVRPTTRDPVVYYHDSLAPDRLAPPLRGCRLVPHNRAELAQIVLVDTPDLDSNDLANRETLERVLEAADVVLYVGSQEKYHDKLGWDLFRAARLRRAFAFVLNKWDRCLHGEGGARPDQDLLRDLETEGFRQPLLFRTCAQFHIDRAAGRNGTALPPGEQFGELQHWLQSGLDRLEIESIKKRGVGQLLEQLEAKLSQACPPELDAASAATNSTWTQLLNEESAETVEVLLNTLEPHQREIEHYFTLQGHRRFRGLMSAYLRLTTQVRFLGSKLKDRVSFLPRVQSAREEAVPTWDLATFMKAASAVAGDRHLDARSRALADRLLVRASAAGFPLKFLDEPTQKASNLDWRQKYGRILAEILQEVQLDRSAPAGWRRFMQNMLVWATDWIPAIVFLGACIRLLWLYFMTDRSIQLFDALIPFVVLLFTLIIFHMLILFFLPLRWPAIRGDFQRRLSKRVLAELQGAYGAIPGQVVAALNSERKQIDELRTEAHRLVTWLQGQEHAHTVQALYVG
jgi:50S ribosome-binding GTPase